MVALLLGSTTIILEIRFLLSGLQQSKTRKQSEKEGKGKERKGKGLKKHETFAKKRRKGIGGSGDFLIKILDIIIIKGKIAAEEGKEDDPKRPYVHLWPLILLP